MASAFPCGLRFLLRCFGISVVALLTRGPAPPSVSPKPFGAALQHPDGGSESPSPLERSTGLWGTRAASPPSSRAHRKISGGRKGVSEAGLSTPAPQYSSNRNQVSSLPLLAGLFLASCSETVFPALSTVGRRQPSLLQAQRFTNYQEPRIAN